MKKLSIIVSLAVALSMMCVPFVYSDESSAEITISDIGSSVPKTHTFPGPVDHIVTFGKGYAATAIKLGVFNKVVLMNTYCKYDSLGLEEVKNLPEDMFISTSKSNIPNVITRMAELETANKFDKVKDVIICDGWSGDLINGLSDAGYKVLGYYPKNYNENIEMTRTLGKLFGSNKAESVVNGMVAAPGKISEKLSEAGITGGKKVRAVSISTNKIQSDGSMGNELITLGGGINVAAGKNPGTGTSFASDPTFFAQNKFDVMFYSEHQGKSAETYISEMGIDPNVKVVAIGNLWVSYGPNVEEGLWGYAGSMYPDCFTTGGEVISVESPSDDNTTVIVAAAIVAVAVVLLAVYFLKFRK